ncbi:MAG TPA: hypothetical protein VIQ62_00590, partial [Burkholderiales bacterium]
MPSTNCTTLSVPSIFRGAIFRPLSSLLTAFVPTFALFDSRISAARFWADLSPAGLAAADFAAGFVLATDFFFATDFGAALPTTFLPVAVRAALAPARGLPDAFFS